MIKQGISLKPGEQIPPSLLEDLQRANKAFTETKNRAKYQTDLATIFQIQNVPTITTEAKFWLGGFVEGEASINVSCKKLNTAAFGILVDPEFSITQHVNGFSMLYMALVYLQAGRISYKSGTNATLVLKVDNRQTLEDKILPFYKNYVVPYGSPEKVSRLVEFENLLNLFKNGAHRDQGRFLTEILPIWDSMRKQVGQSNQTFPDLASAQNYAVAFVKNKTP